MNIDIEVLPHGIGLELPKYATEGSAGFDLRAAVAARISLAPGEHRLVPTGLKFAIPRGFEGQIRPRSGLALRYGVTVLNSPGTVDADYRGEVGVILVNFSSNDFVVTRGDRIAQMVVAAVASIPLVVVETVDATSRGDGGFGHTGIQ